MAFIETPRFPLAIGFGASGGPGYSTTIVVLDSGKEQRNANWTYSRGRWNVALGVRSEADLETLIKYFHVAQGEANGFRFKDRWDYKSTDINSTVALGDQTLATADGATETFQLKKTYTVGSSTQARVISKPVSGTVLVGVDSALQTEGVDYSIDYTTGIITFVSGAVPVNGAVVTAGFEYDVPVRFALPELPVVLQTYKAGRATVNIVEIRI